jgi:hypothetical protein
MCHEIETLFYLYRDLIHTKFCYYLVHVYLFVITLTFLQSDL